VKRKGKTSVQSSMVEQTNEEIQWAVVLTPRVSDERERVPKGKKGREGKGPSRLQLPSTRALQITFLGSYSSTQEHEQTKHSTAR
jgi:hypothetical protein